MRIFLVATLLSMILQPAGVIDSVVADQYYAESLSADEEADLRSATLGSDTYVVVLASDVGDINAYADRILDQLFDATVLVLTPSEIAAVSNVYDSSAMDDALDASFATFDTDIALGVREFNASLSGAARTSTETGSGGSGWGLLLFLAGGGSLVGFLIWRSKRKQEEALAEDLEEARAAVRLQVGSVANDILELSDRVTLAERDEVSSLYAKATATFAGIDKRLESAPGLSEIERLGEDLDEARWQLEVVEAKLDGRVPPAKPIDRPVRCFFDPNHRAGTEEAEIRTPAGQRAVSVCRSCKSQLMRGDQPNTRDIAVGGRQVPAPRAPKSYGGQGIDGLDVFNVIVGGANVAFDLRRARQRRRPRATSLGLPSTRSTTSRRSNRSRRSTSTRSRGRASRSRKRGSSSRRRR